MIFQGDLVIKLAIEMGLEDIRKNPWVIEDIFSDLLSNPILSKRYGIKEVNRAKEFILNNDIPILMKLRLDKEAIPSISIALGTSNEIPNLGTLGDTTSFVNEYTPEHIQQPINYIMPPTSPLSYDKALGEITFKNSQDIADVSPGMVIIDPSTGNGFIVNEKPSNVKLIINANSELPSTKIAVIPQYPVYRAKVERNFVKETYSIGCHTSDPSTLIFLFSVVKYILLRYKESLLESNNFQLSSMNCTDMNKNQSFGAENVYSRFINLTGQVEETWIKAPHRVIEIASFNGGINIISQDPPTDIKNNTEESWKTIK